MAAYPTMLEYQEAVQNPRTCFSDPELAGGNIVVDALGLPKPITGGFASVYQVTSGKKHFAVRCFLRTHAEVQDRYARISEFQKKHKPGWMCEFVYLAQGIKVKGQWYPILKMEWVQGDQLNVHIDKLGDNRKAMRGLGEKFVTLLRAMQKLGIAHGDLQHGNILVANGMLKLIDYDAMYIPGMTGKSHEIGHRNYQHPKRTTRDFGDTLDHFSARVIMTSLTALAVKPQLWAELKGGDEGLLLRREDLLAGLSSKAMLALEALGDKQVDEQLLGLLGALDVEASAVTSPLEAPAKVVSQKATSLAPAAATSNARNTGNTGNTGNAGNTTSAAPAALATPVGASGTPQQLQVSVAPERAVFAISVIAAAGLGLAFWQGELPDLQAAAGAAAALAFAALFFFARFASLPQVRRLRGYIAEHGELKGKMQRSEAKAAALADIEASFRKTRRLDFDALLDAATTAEGHAVLTSLMAFLETYEMTEQQATGLAPDVNKRLARRGLKDALRFHDVIVSRSMADGEAAEAVAVVLRSGKQITEPALSRKEADALLSWRGSLERQFVTTASGEERLHFEALSSRALELEVAIEQHADVNGWRFLGLIFGLG